MEFKVGDRVRYVDDGDLGIVMWHLGGETMDVEWDKGGLAEVSIYDAELVEEQSNRTYYEPTEIGQTPREKDPGNTAFEDNVHRHLNKIANILISKNKAYGDSALNPIRAFSKASRIEQLNVRIDDKISRIQRGTDFEDEDTVRDLIGYLVLRLIAEESE